MSSTLKLSSTRRTLIRAFLGTAGYFAKARPMENDRVSVDKSFDFGKESKQVLETTLSDRGYRGQLQPSTVDRLMKSEGLSRDALMTNLLPLARSFAHPPLSNFLVGAVALGRSGGMYLGANIEVPRNMLGFTVHAEQAAIANAYMSDENGIDAVAVTAPPCGHCRQFLSELSLELSLRVLIKNMPEVTLSDLLPHPFGPKDLGLKQGALPIRRAHLILAAPSDDPLTLAALSAASSSYSPYTKSPSGVAVSTSAGRIFTGSYIENAAFNPSLPPLQVCMSGVLAAGKNAGSVVRAVLVEGSRNSISQQSATRDSLAALYPSARFDFAHAE